jgi:Protein of unknown function (DUF3431)
MKIEIFTFAFNRPDLLELQVDCLKKFLLNDFNLNVIHDTRNGHLVNEFATVCKKISEKYQELTVYYYPHESLDGLQSSEYHSEVLQWTYDEIVKPLDDRIVLFLDHDIFLTEDLNLVEEIDSYDILGLLQEREHIKYVWPGLVAFKTSSFDEINWKCGEVEGQKVDSGGGTYTILRDENIKFKNTGATYPEVYKGIDLTDQNITLGYNFELHFDEKFLHSRNACNWDTFYNVKDGNKTNLLLYILNDILSTKTKRDFEIVVSRYNENLEWTNNYLDYCTIYNKGEPIERKCIRLSNIGREGHTFLKHIVNNYKNLANHTMFLQGDPINPHSPNLLSLLNHITHTTEVLPDFFWVSERLVEGDFEYIREPYHKIVPNIKYAYEKIFGGSPEFETFTFGAGAQFCASRELIYKRPIEFYRNILCIFEYEPDVELDEVAIKLLGNPGAKIKFHPLNPELGLHLERFWGIIFNQI